VVSFREHVGHERLSLKVGTSTAGAGTAVMRDVNGEGCGMGKIALSEQSHAALANIDRAHPLIKVYPARVGALNANGKV